MADEVQIIITLRKTCTDNTEAMQIYNAVKSRVADRPDIKVAGHITTHVDVPDPVLPG